MEGDPRSGCVVAVLRQLGKIFCCGKCVTSSTYNYLIQDQDEQLQRNVIDSHVVAPITQAPHVESIPNNPFNKKTTIQTQGKSETKDEWLDFAKKRVLLQNHKADVDLFIVKKKLIETDEKIPTSSIHSPLGEHVDINREVNVNPIRKDPIKKEFGNVVLPRKPGSDENYSLSAISFHFMEKAQHHLAERHRLFQLAKKYKTAGNESSAYKYFELAKKQLAICQLNVSLLKNENHINDFNLVIIKSYYVLLYNFLKDATPILDEHDSFLKDLVHETQQDIDSPTIVGENKGLTNDRQEICLGEGLDTDFSLATQHREKAQDHLKHKRRLLDLAKKHSKINNVRVAAHYFEEAKKHSKLTEEANNLAVAAILRVNKTKHPESKTIDLHYLFVKEAIQALDSFLDDEISILRNCSLKVCVTVITGRGKHSADGIPKIKPAVTERLRQRSLRYHAFNPGALKVRINVSSPLTNELNEYAD